MKKAQSAMEYLMTYGWAILIIIVVVAALYAMGVLRPPKSAVPCSPCFSYFAFVDYAAGTLKIRNGGYDIDTIAMTAPTGASVTPTTIVASGDLTITGIPTTGDQVVTISYKVTASGLTHTDTATIRQ